ncbi:MAG: zinc-binding alcohol dehydrogenase family protein [Chloroflexota bacterium]|nr:zinc-binding alcohol dehydrogenase family protein [Chloroflexota bacterium]
MKAWILEEQADIAERPLRLVELSTPHAQEGEVRIKVLVCGICRTDIHIAEGDLPLKKSPIILGHEVVGIVDEVGDDVEGFGVGDRVGAYWLYSTCGECKACLSGRENYCPEIKCTGWDENGGYAEYMTVPAAYALPLDSVQMAVEKIAPLMCPGIAGYAAFELTGARKGDRLGLYGFGPTAYYVLKVAQSKGIEVYVSTRSEKNIRSAREEGAAWAANAAEEEMPGKLDAAILFPPAGNLVEPVLAQVKRGGVLVMAPVSASPIVIENYSAHLWGRDIRTLYNLNRADAEAFIALVDELDLDVRTSVFSFDEVQDALVLADEGKLEQPNGVIKVADSR